MKISQSSLLIIALFFLTPTLIKAQELVITVEEEMAEEKENKLEISGSIDTYFRTNLTGDTDLSPSTSFANLSGFSLGMANLKVSKDGQKAGFMADLVVGPRGEDATFNSTLLRPEGNSSIVNQLYAYVKLNDKVTATLGNFNTFLGYEMISPTENFNYSMSYLFSYGPFSHTGLKLDFETDTGFNIMLGVFNPTDFTEYNPLDDYVAGAQVGYSFDQGSIYLNSLFDGDFFQIDLTAGLDVSDKVYIGLNASSASDNFVGAAAYLQLQTSDQLKLGTRVEYFSDKGVGVLIKDESIIDLSFSANYTIGDLVIIPEFRIDVASQDIFADDTDFNSSLASFILAAVYGF